MSPYRGPKVIKVLRLIMFWRENGNFLCQVLKGLTHTSNVALWLMADLTFLGENRSGICACEKEKETPHIFLFCNILLSHYKQMLLSQIDPVP